MENKGCTIPEVLVLGRSEIEEVKVFDKHKGASLRYVQGMRAKLNINVHPVEIIRRQRKLILWLRLPLQENLLPRGSILGRGLI